MKRMHLEITNTPNISTEADKRRIIANLISRVRFDRDTASNVPPLEQVGSLRRISLLFTDSFSPQALQKHARIWERLVIVLSQQHSLEERKRRRKRGGGESGFKFTLMNSTGPKAKNGEEYDYVVVTVPLDFLDDEIVREFEQNLPDLFVYDQDEAFFGLGLM